jgi:putative FmdB family regulatory protein
MPTYVYKCEDCGTKYEIFHKSVSATEDIVCPNCESKSANKMMSATSICGCGTSSPAPTYPSGGGGGCATGNCPFN